MLVNDSRAAAFGIGRRFGQSPAVIVQAPCRTRAKQELRSLVTDEGERRLEPGDVAGFPAGRDNGHHVVNDADRAVRPLEVGARRADDDTYCSGIKPLEDLIRSNVVIANRDRMKARGRGDSGARSWRPLRGFRKR